MLLLLGSIILTSYLTLSFKVLDRFKVPVLQSIVFNYWTCVITGSIVDGGFPINQETVNSGWFPWAGLMGTVFILLFNLIAYITQKIGVAVASVANKLSLVIPFIFSVYLYNERATTLKISGIIIALIAVTATCWPKKKKDTQASQKLSLALVFLLPLILFIGSGLLDTMIKYVEQNFIDPQNQNRYLITAFATAAVIGSVLLFILFLSSKEQFDKRSVLAGICIGIPNYFSIWCLMRVLKQFPGESSAIIPINNMGIVLFSSVVAALFFRERLSSLNWVGILLSIGAIALIAFG